MLTAARQLLEDFLSTILFLVVYVLTGQIAVAIIAGILAAIVLFAFWRLKGRKPDAMQWLSVGLVLCLGAVSLVTKDVRFVLAKPALIHFAIGAVMLRRGWLLRYMPPIARQYVPEHVIVAAGLAWALFQFALGVAILVVAIAFDFEVWAWFVGAGVIALQIAAFLVTYATLRIMGTRQARRLRAASG